MNYARDALWWFLDDDVVRDLACLLTAPSPFARPGEIPVSALLGEHGFRALKTLDGHPRALRDFVAARPVRDRDAYMGVLWDFWRAYAPDPLPQIALFHWADAIASVAPPVPDEHKPSLIRGLRFGDQELACWTGKLVTGMPEPEPDAPCLPLPPLCLAPLRLPDRPQHAIAPGVNLRLVRRADGVWHEDERFFFMAA